MKSDLRSLTIRSAGQPQYTDLLSLFDRAYEHAKNYPSDSVLTYAARQVLSADIVEENWTFCESLLLRAAISEPTMLSVLGDIYDRFAAFHTDNRALTSTLESICSYHAPLQQGNEVSWALWLAKKMFVTISKTVGDKIAGVDDDIVALIALDLVEQAYLHTTQLGPWRGYMTAPNLYEDHWLLAYEAHEHGWLPSKATTSQRTRSFRFCRVTASASMETILHRLPVITAMRRTIRSRMVPKNMWKMMTQTSHQSSRSYG